MKIDILKENNRLFVVHLSKMNACINFDIKNEKLSSVFEYSTAVDKDSMCNLYLAIQPRPGHIKIQYVVYFTQRQCRIIKRYFLILK